MKFRILLMMIISSNALALELYVDKKTQQLFAEPGDGRILLGSFEKKEEVDKLKEEFSLSKNQLNALDEHIKDPTEGKLQINDKGIKFESKDGNFEMAINGRMQVDSQMNVADSGVTTGNSPTSSTQLADGTTIRRARIGVEGTYYKDFQYKFEYDFARGNGTTAAGITDAYINWVGYEPLGVKVGSFKEPFSLEEATSNRWTTFIERNMAVNAFSDGPNAYKSGIGLTWSQPRWTAAGALMTEPVGAGWGYTSAKNTNGAANRNGGSGDTGWELTGRVTGLPWYADKTHFLHIGASGSERYFNNQSNATNFKFAAALNSNVDRSNILDTGTLTAANLTMTRMGGESAIVYGPFSAQAEYIQADISGTGFTSESMNGYYGYVSYFLTGESRAYKAKTGAWDRIKPNKNFSLKNGGLGAWEIASGYDYLDLNDKTLKGGRASTAKFGVNWYPNSHLKVMANYIHALEIQAPSTGKGYDGSNLDMFEMRAQVDF